MNGECFPLITIVTQAKKLEGDFRQIGESLITIEQNIDTIMNMIEIFSHSNHKTVEDHNHLNNVDALK